MSDAAGHSSSAPNGFQGDFVSGSMFDRFVRVAGFLAEHGVANVTLVHSGQRQVLCARATDLPGQLKSALIGEGPVTLLTTIANFEITASTFRWSTPSSALAQTLHTLA